jgi:hypothetical protein
MMNANTNGWIDWPGGSMPTNLSVDVQLRSGTYLFDRDPTTLWWSRHDAVDSPIDVIAYRIRYKPAHSAPVDREGKPTV